MSGEWCVARGEQNADWHRYVLTIFLAVICFFGLTGEIVRALTPVAVEKNGSATLYVDAPRDQDGFAIHLADVLTITVQIDGVKTLTVKPPERITKSPGWRLLEVTPASTAQEADKSFVWRQTYVVEPLAPGDLSLALEPFASGEGGTSGEKVVWRPLLIRVRTEIAIPDLKALRDPVVIERLPPIGEADPWPWIVLGGAIVAVIVSALGYRWWRRHSRPRAGAAVGRALRQLDRVLAYHLPERNETVRFHSLLANVLRRYLERKFHIPARHRTTKEFLELLQSCSAIGGADKEFLRHLFISCDLAKFARADVSAEECVTRAAQARAFIEVCGQTAPAR